LPFTFQGLSLCAIATVGPWAALQANTRTAANKVELIRHDGDIAALRGIRQYWC
jgi:hypothetical protein